MEQQIIEKAFDLLAYDVDQMGVDERLSDSVFSDICKSCDGSKRCKDCIKEYYIRKATGERMI